MNQKISFRDGTSVARIGQGTWYLGEDRASFQSEKEALTVGVASGMHLIDTAEMYGNGKAEELVGETIKGMDREKLFIVSKVYPHNAGRRNIFTSCENSLKRMKLDYLDLYLLHWRGSVPLEETVACMEELKKQGKIRRWGVSNFDTSDMEELFAVPDGENCEVNQVLYHVASRGIEYDLLPWMREHDVRLMAYCPIAQGGRLSRNVVKNQVLENIAKQHNATVEQVMLSFTVRDGNSIAIPRTGKKAHAVENAKALDLVLTEEDLREIDREFPYPTRKTYLDMQ